MKHKHYDIMTAWAADTTQIVQVNNNNSLRWVECECPTWAPEHNYRFKPVKKPDVEFDVFVEQENAYPKMRHPEHWQRPNVRIKFDGDTGELISVFRIDQ